MLHNKSEIYSNKSIFEDIWLFLEYCNIEFEQFRAEVPLWAGMFSLAKNVLLTCLWGGSKSE